MQETLLLSAKPPSKRSTSTASTGWETMLSAIVNSGFAITGTWPMRTEQTYRAVSMGANVKAPKEVPHGALPIFAQRFSPPSFGLTDYADLFTNRQLVFITTMMKLARAQGQQMDSRREQCARFLRTAGPSV